MAEDFQDKTLTCVQCGVDFVFTAQEQRKFHELVLKLTFKKYNEPKRCLPCRQARRITQGRM